MSASLCGKIYHYGRINCLEDIWLRNKMSKTVTLLMISVVALVSLVFGIEL